MQSLKRLVRTAILNKWLYLNKSTDTHKLNTRLLWQVGPSFVEVSYTIINALA